MTRYLVRIADMPNALPFTVHAANPEAAVLAARKLLRPWPGEYEFVVEVAPGPVALPEGRVATVPMNEVGR